MGFGYDSNYSQPYYLGGGSSTLTPFITDSALGGRNYMIDWSAEIPLMFRSVPLLRNQQDASDSPGEQSINPEGFWRRSGESWHFGAGQEQFDRADANPFRFRASKGIDVWDKWHFSLLPDTDPKTLSSATNQKLAVAGSFLYYTDGTVLRRTADITPDTPTFTTITGTPGTQASDIVSDGFNIWTAHGTSGIYKTTRGAATTASHITGTVTLLGYARNRVLAANLGSVYDVTTLAMGGGGALPAALFTHANTDFTWVGFAEGSGFIYLAGFSGDKSLIYRTAVKEDGTALSAPAVAAELPDGETVTAIQGYLGKFVIIGTNKGFRLAVVGSSGDLIIGERVDTSTSVLAFEGQEEFVWFGWGAFGATTTGLGRLSTSTFSDLDNLVPAYASDLMVEGSAANINSIVTFQGIRVFTVHAVGISAQHNTNLVTSGYIDTGEISYNMTEKKIGVSIDAQHFGEEGMHEISISVDGGAFVSLGAHEAHLFPRTLGAAEGSFFEFRHTLHRDESDATAGLSVHSWLLLAQPLATVTNNIFATFYLAPETEDLVDGSLAYDTFDELDFIKGLASSKEVTTFQTSNRLYAVIVDDYELPLHSIQRGQSGMTGFNGSILVKMKEVL